jgi:CubicO group peptidase (beta-lactamase class C family)
MQSVARIAELATGKPWSQVAREEILDPCGMANTAYDDFGPLNPAVAGGIRASAGEYMRFLGMVMAGGRSGGVQVLSGASLAEMFVDQTGGAPIHHSPWPGSPDTHADEKPPGYGFGCWAVATNPATGREDEIASPGAYGAFPWADRCRNLYGMILVHNLQEARRSHSVSLRLIALVREAVGGCVTAGIDPAPPRPGARSARGGGSRFEGSAVGPFLGAIGAGGPGAAYRADGRLLPGREAHREHVAPAVTARAGGDGL